MKNWEHHVSGYVFAADILNCPHKSNKFIQLEPNSKCSICAKLKRKHKMAEENGVQIQNGGTMAMLNTLNSA